MGKASWKKYTLNFRNPSGTSRGVLKTKDSWFLCWHDQGLELPAFGECSIIEGLSPDPLDSFEYTLDQVCAWLNSEASQKPDLSSYPAIRFGLETLQLDIASNGTKRLISNDFTEGKSGMLINGLIWMGEPDFMKAQVRDKVEAGFHCIKLKIGAMDFQQELDILRWIRTEFSAEKLELRVDANGAFSPVQALAKLEQLATFNLHSIEQPIAPYQWEAMANLCEVTPFPIALDEELIGINVTHEKKALLKSISPQYIILKPSLVGGLHSSDEWIDAADKQNIGWWMTSALESNIGLNAIAQHTASKKVALPQGLGTGSLYSNNLDSPLYIQGEFIHTDPQRSWNLSPLLNE